MLTLYSNTQKTISSSESTDEVTITNEKVPFEFYKEWMNSDEPISWPEPAGQKVNIKVEVGRKAKGSGSADAYKKTYVIGGSNLQNNAEISPTEGDSPKLKVIVTLGAGGSPDQYRFSIEGLDYYSDDGVEYEYFVKETDIDTGFKLSHYKLGNATSAPNQSVTSGGTIVNATEESYELPHTGGIGTHPYRTAGIIMVITALLGVFYMKRRENRHSA